MFCVLSVLCVPSGVTRRATAPSNGPGARQRNTHCHPIACAAIGSSRIDDHRQQEPGARLDGQRRADVVARAVLRDERRELRRIGDHRDTPDDREQQEDDGGARKTKPAAAQHAPLTTIAHDAMRALPMRSANAPAAAEPMAPLPIVDERHRRSQHGRRSALRRRRAEAGRRERRDPGPHGVQLPHVTQVAERRQPRLPFGEYACAAPGSKRALLETYGPSPTRPERCRRRRRPAPTPTSISVATATRRGRRREQVRERRADVSAPITTPSASAAPLARTIPRRFSSPADTPRRAPRR